MQILVSFHASSSDSCYQVCHLNRVGAVGICVVDTWMQWQPPSRYETADTLAGMGIVLVIGPVRDQKSSLTMPTALCRKVL